MLNIFLFGCLGSLVFELFRFYRLQKRIKGLLSWQANLRWQVEYVLWTTPWILGVGGIIIIFASTEYTAFFMGLGFTPFVKIVNKYI